jgi:myo-inositol-1-phosphate synthase
VVVDAIRCAKLAMDRGQAGAIGGPSAYFMKSPPVQYTDDTARNMTDAFIAGEAVDRGVEVVVEVADE